MYPRNEFVVADYGRAGSSKETKLHKILQYLVPVYMPSNLYCFCQPTGWGLLPKCSQLKVSVSICSEPCHLNLPSCVSFQS